MYIPQNIQETNKKLRKKIYHVTGKLRKFTSMILNYQASL